jgi:uncharacterized Fe-S cluster-containing MiaB family protein
MLTEDLIKCGKCGKDALYTRHGGYGWYQFDACLSCGYATDSEGNTGEEVIKIVVEANKCATKEELLKKLGVSAEVTG